METVYPDPQTVTADLEVPVITAGWTCPMTGTDSCAGADSSNCSAC